MKVVHPLLLGHRLHIHRTMYQRNRYAISDHK
jgi:hypothetical protein